MNDQDYMRKALSLARKGKGFTSPNPCVGALVVKDNVIIGKGWHKGPGLAHAEVEAINDADQDLSGSTIYVTLEPCNHFGKTPPCTHKILEAKIKRVVIGCKDPNPYVAGGGIGFLKEKGLIVESGILEKESEELIEDFVWYTKNDKKPFVILKTASTLDGRTGTSTGDSKWITNSKSRAYVHQIRHEVDGILVGSGTLKADDPSLTARIDNMDTKDPHRIILDSTLSIDSKAKVLNIKSEAKTILVCSKAYIGQKAGKEKKAILEESGAIVLPVGLKNHRLDLNQLMIKLGKIGILSIMIEGGSKVAASALKAGIVNKVMFFIAPKILGSSDGIPVCDGKGPVFMKDAFNLEKVRIKRFDDDILVQGYLNS